MRGKAAPIATRSRCGIWRPTTRASARRRSRGRRASTIRTCGGRAASARISLARGGTRTDDWHFAHLFSPRAVVPQSVMPAYPRLFDGAPDRPRQEARDLVAYLETLGRARELAGPEGEARAREACNCPDDEMAQMAFSRPAQCASRRVRGACRRRADASRRRSRARSSSSMRCIARPVTERVVKATALEQPGCFPRPTNLAEHDYAPERIAGALWNGVAGTAMPAWRDHSLDDLAALVGPYERSARAGPEPSLPGALMELGRRAYRRQLRAVPRRTGRRQRTGGRRADAWRQPN